MSSSIVPDSESVEAVFQTAEIIPFPSRLKPEEPRSDDRLARALASLTTAMMEQQAAIAAWRGALGELKETTSGLGESLQRYQISLGALSGSVSALEGKAQLMEQWADGVLLG
jgi:hypothetical protein